MLNILYEDDAVLVCVKAAGVATQTKRIGQKDMESMLKTYRVQKGEPAYIGIVHRLDQPVCGVMVFAKTKEAAAGLSRQIAAKAADKYYYAVTDGVPMQKKGTLKDYLLRNGRKNSSEVVDEKVPGAKKAELSYEVLAAQEGKALLRILLATGRHHQIRVQLSHAGWPIAGDKKYNFKEHMRQETETLCLCSYKIGFLHPVTKKKMEFELENPYRI